jgi:hypothetical protein
MICARSLNSISSEHHDQGGQPNGNQEHRPIHDVEAKEPSHPGFVDRKTCALAVFGFATVTEAL